MIPVAAVRSRSNASASHGTMPRDEQLVQERLYDAFATEIMHAASFDYRRLLTDVGADLSGTFEERLRLMPKMTASWRKTGLNRTALYQRYVVDDQEEVSTGKYDFTKPDMVAFEWSLI